MILDEIVAAKIVQLQKEKQHISLDGMKYMIKNMPSYPNTSFKKALVKDGISIIAEIKKASPSKGLISENFEPIKMANEYQKGGADAISVLTERRFFGGDDRYLSCIKAQVPLPVLRKDFVVDVWQIYQSRLIGSDAILLICAILDKEELKKFHIIANMLGMDCLVEVHDERELDVALEVGAEIIGINNRNLNDFSIDLETTERLIKFLPSDKIVVAESGIRSINDVSYMVSLGVDALLVGEAFVRSENPENLIARFKEVNRQSVM